MCDYRTDEDKTLLPHRELAPPMSIKSRIAAFSGGSSKSKEDVKTSDQPTGQIYASGPLSKAGAGILASTYHKRFCVVHGEDPVNLMLSVYEKEDMARLKGNRLGLNGATVSQADDKLNVATFLDGKPVTAKFKAASSAVAVVWATRLSAAAKGELVPEASASEVGPAPSTFKAPSKPPLDPAATTLAPTAPVTAVHTSASSAIVVSPEAAFIPGLLAVGARLGKLSGVGMGKEAAMGHLSSGSSQEEVAAHLSMIVSFLETCADHTAMRQLELYMLAATRLHARASSPRLPFKPWLYPSLAQAHIAAGATCRDYSVQQRHWHAATASNNGV